MSETLEHKKLPAQGNSTRAEASTRSKEASFLADLSKNTGVTAHATNQSLHALLKAPFPTVSGIESSMEALVEAFAWNLESDKVLALENGLSAFATDHCFLFHGHLPLLAWYSL